MASVFDELFEDRPLSLPLAKRQQFIVDAEEAGAISSASQYTLVVRNQQGYVSLADSAIEITRLLKKAAGDAAAADRPNWTPFGHFGTAELYLDSQLIDRVDYVPQTSMIRLLAHGDRETISGELSGVVCDLDTARVVPVAGDLAVDATGQIRQPGACTRAKMVAAHLTTTQTVFWPLRWLFPWVASNPQPVIGAEIRIVLTKLSQGLQFTTNATSNTYVASDAVISNIRGMFVAMKPNLQLEAALAAKYAAGQSVVKVSERCFTFRGSSTTATAWTDNWSLSCPPLRAYAFLVDANAFSATAATAALANQTNFLASGLQNVTFRLNSDVFPERSLSLTMAASTIGSVAAQDAARALYSFIDVSGNEQVPVDADQFASIYPCIAADFSRSPDMFLSKGSYTLAIDFQRATGTAAHSFVVVECAQEHTWSPAGQNKFVISQ